MATKDVNKWTNGLQNLPWGTHSRSLPQTPFTKQGRVTHHKTDLILGMHLTFTSAPLDTDWQRSEPWDSRDVRRDECQIPLFTGLIPRISGLVNDRHLKQYIHVELQVIYISLQRQRFWKLFGYANINEKRKCCPAKINLSTKPRNIIVFCGKTLHPIFASFLIWFNSPLLDLLTFLLSIVRYSYT